MSRTSTTWHLRRMHTEDIAHADSIRQLVGWNQTGADWRRLLALAPDSCFVTEMAGVPVGTVTTTSYASTLAWIGMLLVHPEQRRQGMGGALLRQAIQHLQGAGVGCIALDATAAGQPLYAGAGFAPVWALARWQGAIPQKLPSFLPGMQTVIPDTVWPPIIALDCRAFGVARPALLHSLAEQSSRVAVAFDGDAGLHGFGMLRPGARAQMLGPLVAADAETAANLLATLCAGLPPAALFWDIPEPNQAAVQLAVSLGFTRQRTLTRMAYGADYPSHDPHLLYAVADLATG